MESKTIEFSKYSGLGNDFIIVDNMSGCYNLHRSLVKDMCTRRFGVGADALMELCSSKEDGCAFRIINYLSHGELGRLCGNGSRCVIKFAYLKGYVTNTHFRFEAPDGLHYGRYSDSSDIIGLTIRDISNIIMYDNGDYFINTGAKHHVQFLDDLERCDVKNEGYQISQNKDLYPDPRVNVMFVEDVDGTLNMRSYEHGVGGETLACGTGAAAAAIAHHYKTKGPLTTVVMPVKVHHGILTIKFTCDAYGSYKDVWLCGPATHVFDGTFSPMN